MITVTRTPKGVRIEGASRYESISRELLDEVRAGHSSVMRLDGDVLLIADDFGNEYAYRLNPFPVIRGAVAFHEMEMM